jgi:Domain of unknown function (DUF4912)
MKDPAADKDGAPVAKTGTKVAPKSAAPNSGAAQARARDVAVPRSPREEPAHPGVSLSPPGTVPESDVRTHSPAAATPPSARLAFEEDLGELPWGYGDGRLICLVRDPSTLYVYWDLSQQQVQQAFGGLGSAQAILKVCTLRGELIRQIEVHLGGRCWYVHGLPAGAELRAELWAAGEKGARLLRSGRPVRLPAAGPSSALEEFYAVLPPAVPLPRDGHFSGGRPLDWKAGAEPPDWDRRASARLGSSGVPGGLPWSSTSPGFSDEAEQGGSADPPGQDES